MSESLPSSDWQFGIAPNVFAKLQALFERTPGLAKVWVYGSRGRGDYRPSSDIDLAVEWQTPDKNGTLSSGLEELELIYRTDLVNLADPLAPGFRARIERDRKLFWEPRRAAVNQASVGEVQMKKFQGETLKQLDRYLAELKKHKAQSDAAQAALRAMEGMEDLQREAADFPKKTWVVLQKTQQLPPSFADQPHSSRFDGTGRAIPNVCLKVPTGGGKTLLAAASVGRVFSNYLARHTGLVLWIVPNEAIYQQTLKTLKNRDHPYRQMLNVAGAGQVKILEKKSPLSKIDTDSHLCVMLLMLASASRQTKETLRFFRDRGNVLGFTPREDDIEANWDLLQAVPNLDAYTSWGTSQEEARATKGSIVKSSLGNVMRLLRPMVVIDEGHHAYTETALKTIDGFNPCFMLELSATPRVGSDKGSGSNILVNVRGTDLDEAEMIKLPIHVDMRGWSDWQSCLASSLERLDGLQCEAAVLQSETNRYIRPILLVQVERTGKDMRDAGFIHAEDAKAYLMQLGLTEQQIAIKTSDRNDLNTPENIDLLSPQCEVRAIITKQALQEGWDCPFAYVLCALAAGKDIRAMTQLMGRILRLPHVAKTGRDALDACYVLCHDAKTGDVVKAIKQSLETEGMGDLGMAVTGPGTETLTRKETFKRRPQFAHLRIYLPRVTWVEHDPMGNKRRRELAYESDIIGRIDWAALNTTRLAQDWAPDARGQHGAQLHLGLELLRAQQQNPHMEPVEDDTALLKLDRARLVRGLLDIVPNAWIVWAVVDAVLTQLLARGLAERAVAASSASLLERLRADLEAERDRLAQAVFEDCMQQGWVEFRLRADATDYALPTEFALELSGKPTPMIRDDAKLVGKSLFEPALAALTDSGLERDVACYLDSQAALQWWHRNVAKAHYGLQGWKRNKVYPDFVFARVSGAGQSTVVVLETKGLHLAGSDDTQYKQALLQRLTQAYAAPSLFSAGEVELIGDGQGLVCDLVFDTGWQGSLNARHFQH
ncbi:MAG: DEAD/DEAH box helicase family protein [Burkholderiales bacterium]|nr:DEAD/DEAH box helicase family protein [Burkholderiales bacterium]